MAIDPSAFAPASAGEAKAPLLNAEGLIHDRDGLAVPAFWHPNVPKWEKQPLSWRQKMSRLYLQELEAKAQKALSEDHKVSRPPARRFTTEYGARWGSRQKNERGEKWQEIERERYDYRTQRHHDLQLGVDVMFDDGNGLVGVQAAGKGEKAPHYQRFLERGGPEKAKRRSIRVIYVEFVRGKGEPVLYEEWA